MLYILREVKMDFAILVFMRLAAACIFAAGAIYLASEGKEGWGWCIFAAVVLGGVTLTTKGGSGG